MLGPAFTLLEATIDRVQTAVKCRAVTCEALVRGYLERIAAYDKSGPSLAAMLTVNAKALEEARAFDRSPACDWSQRPLACVAVVLKDNYNTADLPTTGGSVIFQHSQPAEDAFVVAKLRRAGAIVLGKTNLHEFALAGMSVSSLGGQTKNPYDLTRTPGGSSGGTGAAVAANFALAGTGSDTVNSIRSPASANALVGIRPTRGVVGRTGIIPVSFTQDTAGPIARTVADAALLLDVMAGEDPDDPITRESRGRLPRSYAASATGGALRGARIGLLQNFFGNAPEHAEVNRVVHSALDVMRDAGAILVPIDVIGLDADTLIRDYDVQRFEFKGLFNAYLARLGAGAPVKSLRELVATGRFDESVVDFLTRADVDHDPLADPEYLVRLGRAAQLRETIRRVMDERDVAALLYPEQKRLVVPIGEAQVDRNGILAAVTGCPALALPAGFSRPTASAPLGVPIGMELFGRPFDEPVLIRLAASFEALAPVRRPPASTPELPGNR